ncbi:Lipid A core -O-antigen ligase [Hartmannibacter diazotrophicus]|uniref:Lipid A core -O-antigen ligase n=1 Tax=Hartmannibacter diazotrophicus TaxID=1482074 RepID=A0A2C9DCI8_9HYPH|nr:O-antigen ligase family protein [Hartmannibacter diazotrophicus]SON57976.1 Lipid A core -O-antigen ligase [Hartmannibacter diazotrophicus]
MQEELAKAPVVSSAPIEGLKGSRARRTTHPVLWAGLRVAYMIGLLFVLVPFGSTAELPMSLVTVYFTVLAMAIALAFGIAKPLRVAAGLAVGLLVLLAGWAFLQTVPLPDHLLANPIWTSVKDLGVTAAPVISVAPGDTRFALLGLALPFIVFLAGLQAFPDDKSAKLLLAFLGISGGVIAVWSIGQFLLSPDMLLTEKKKYYLDSVTGVFVNRNTAATYFGICSLILFSLAWQNAQKVDWGRLSAWIGGAARASMPAFNWRMWTYSILMLVCLLALFMTRSRAGVGSSFLTFLAMVPILAAMGFRRERKMGFGRSRRTPPWQRAMRAAMAMVIVVIAGVAFSGRAAYRASIEGVDDPRFCVWPGIVHAVRNNWLTGTGLGTFQDIFPAYRDPQCGITGTFTRAHSVYLQGFLELGIVFVIAMVVGLAALVIIHVHGLKSRRSYAVFPALGFGAILLVAAHSVMDFSLQIPGFAVIFAATLAATTAISLGRNALPSQSKPKSTRSQPPPVNLKTIEMEPPMVGDTEISEDPKNSRRDSAGPFPEGGLKT